MKNIYTLLLIMVSAFSFAQTNGITYQAVILNPQGEQLPGQNNSRAPLSNQEICLRFDIKNNSQLEYQETITTTTDAFGMVNVVIGTGSKTAGSAANFNALIWSASAKTLVVGLSTSGSCSSFIEISNQNFTGVPYSFATKTTENVTGVVAISNGGTGAATAAGAKVNLGLNNVDNTADVSKPISIATQNSLNLKANIASPTFTGTVAGIDKTMIGLNNVDNTADLLKPVSTATQTALTLKANINSPVFTGTPSLPIGAVAVTQVVGDNSTAIATTSFVKSTAESIYTRQSISGASIAIPNGQSLFNYYTITGQPTNLSFGIPSGAALDGNSLLVKITAASSEVQIVWDAVYVGGIDLSLPVITDKTMILQFIFNADAQKWNLAGLTSGIFAD